MRSLAIWLMMAVLLAATAEARTLDEVRARGKLVACLYPNALPFSKENGNPEGIYVELARAVASALAVELQVNWLIPRSRRRAGDCDIGFDEVQGEEAGGYGVMATEPYLRTGIALLVRSGVAVGSYADLKPALRIGVPLGSAGEGYLQQRGLIPRNFALTQEMEAALGAGDLDAILVPTHATAYALQEKPRDDVTLVHAYVDEPTLAWNLVATLRKADKAFLDAVNQALASLRQDGSLARLYSRYGIPYVEPVSTGRK